MRTLAFAAAIAFSAAAFGHGEKPHAAKQTDTSKSEETAFGRPADPKKAKRTIEVDMTDSLRFTPNEIEVERGDVVRFLVANKGRAQHEMVLGTLEDLKKHAELMRRFPEMEHDEPNIAHVAPGRAGELGWQFTKAGEFYYACLVPGHFEAGMVGKIIVTKGAAR